MQHIARMSRTMLSTNAEKRHCNRSTATRRSRGAVKADTNKRASKMSVNTLNSTEPHTPTSPLNKKITQVG